MQHHEANDTTVVMEPLHDAQEEEIKKTEAEKWRNPSPISPVAFQRHCDHILSDCVRDARGQMTTLEHLSSAFRSRVLFHAAKQHSRSSSPSLVVEGDPGVVEWEEEVGDRGCRKEGGGGSSRTQRFGDSVSRVRPTSTSASLASGSEPSSSPLSRKGEEGEKKKKTRRAIPLQDQCVEDIMQRCVYIQQRRSVLVHHLQQLSEVLMTNTTKRGTSHTTSGKKKDAGSTPTSASDAGERAASAFFPLEATTAPRDPSADVPSANDEEARNITMPAWWAAQEHQRRTAQAERIRQVKRALGIPLTCVPSCHFSTSAVAVSSGDEKREGMRGRGDEALSVDGTRREEKEEEEEETPQETAVGSSHSLSASCPNRRPEVFFRRRGCACGGVPFAANTSPPPPPPPLFNVTDVEKEEEEEAERRRRSGRNVNPKGGANENPQWRRHCPSSTIPTVQTARSTLDEEEAEEATHMATVHLAAFFLHFAMEEERAAHLILPLSPTQSTFEAFYKEAIETRALHRIGRKAGEALGPPEGSTPAAVSPVESSALPDHAEGVEEGLSLLWGMMQDDLQQKQLEAQEKMWRTKEEKGTPLFSSSAAAAAAVAPPVVHSVSSSSDEDDVVVDDSDVEEEGTVERKRAKARVGGPRRLPWKEDDGDGGGETSFSSLERRLPCVVLPLVQSLWQYACEPPWLSDDDNEEEAKDGKNPPHPLGETTAANRAFENTAEAKKEEIECRQNGMLPRMHRLRETHRVPLGMAIPPHVLLGSHYVVPSAFLPTEASSVFVGSGVDAVTRPAAAAASSSSSNVLPAATVAANRLIATLCRRGSSGGSLREEEEEDEKKKTTWGERTGGEGRWGSYGGGGGGGREGISSHSRREDTTMERRKRGEDTTTTSSSSSSRIAAVCASSPEVKSLRESALLQTIWRVVEHRWTFTRDDPLTATGGEEADHSREHPTRMPSEGNATAPRDGTAWEKGQTTSGTPPAGDRHGPCFFFSSSTLPPLRLPSAHFDALSRGPTSPTPSPLPTDAKVPSVDEMERVESFLQVLSIRLVVEITTRVWLYQNALRHMQEGEAQLLLSTPLQRACLLTSEPFVPLSPSLSVGEETHGPQNDADASAAPYGKERGPTEAAASSVPSRETKNGRPSPPFIPAAAAPRMREGRAAAPQGVVPFSPTAFVPLLLLTLPEVPHIFYGLAYAFGACLQSDAALGSRWCGPSCAPQAVCGGGAPPPRSNGPSALPRPFSSSSSAVETSPNAQREEEGTRPLACACPPVVARVLRTLSSHTPALLPLIRLWWYLWTYVFIGTTNGEEEAEDGVGRAIGVATTGNRFEHPPSSPLLPVPTDTSMFWWMHEVVPAACQEAMEAARLLRCPPLVWGGLLNGGPLPPLAGPWVVSSSPFSRSASFAPVSSIRADDLPGVAPPMRGEVQAKDVSDPLANPVYDLLAASENRFVKRLVQEIKAVVLSREEERGG